LLFKKRGLTCGGYGCPQIFEEVVIPRDRKLTQQIHSIKKKATDAGYSRYDTEKNESHHADKYWSLALAVHAAGRQKRKRKRKAIDASIV